MLQKGNVVKQKKYGYTGIIEKTFTSWEDLKVKQYFITIDTDNEGENMNNTEKLINGDPKDAWLESQEIPYSDKQLTENWYSVRCFDGGVIWTCESLLELIDVAIN